MAVLRSGRDAVSGLRSPDRRPALRLTAYGQLTPVLVLSQARGRRAPPATRRGRPR